jgi:adenylate cyclase
MSLIPSLGARSTPDPGASLRGLPSVGEINAGLDAVLASVVFAQAGRSRELLRFVVAETLAGRGERLKGYTIAVEVFGRSADFDAQSDPLVRVEAGRLRKRLAEYYHGVGRNDIVRIALPRGGYAPTFEYTKARLVPGAARNKDASAPTVSVAPAAAAPRSRWPEAALAVIAIACLALAAVVVGTRDSDNDNGAAAFAVTAKPIVNGTAAATRLLVMPLRDLNDAGRGGFAGGLSEELVNALIAFEVVAIADPSAGEIEAESLPELRARTGARYALAGSVRVADNVARVAVRLIDTDDGTLFWASSIDEPLNANTIAAEERVANTIAATLASYLGPIYAREVERVAAKPVAELDARDCVLHYYGYTYTFAAAARAESIACMNRTVVSEPKRASAWAALSSLEVQEFMYGVASEAERAAALERALEAARTALDVDGASRPAAVALATVALARDDRAAFDRAVERALALRPEHPGVLVNIGLLLVMAGQSERGLAVLDQAAPLIYRAPNFMHVGYALGHLGAQRYDKALEAALKIDAADWPLAQLTKIAAAARAQRPEIAARELRRLAEFYPDLAERAPRWLDHAHLDPTVHDAVSGGLVAAGLALP